MLERSQEHAWWQVERKWRQQQIFFRIPASVILTKEHRIETKKCWEGKKRSKNFNIFIFGGKFIVKTKWKISGRMVKNVKTEPFDSVGKRLALAFSIKLLLQMLLGTESLKRSETKSKTLKLTGYLACFFFFFFEYFII